MSGTSPLFSSQTVYYGAYAGCHRVFSLTT